MHQWEYAFATAALIAMVVCVVWGSFSGCVVVAIFAACMFDGRRD